MSKPRLLFRGYHALIGIVALFFAFNPLSCDAGASKILEDTIDRVYDLSPTATVSIRNTDGRIYIYATDTPQLIIRAVRRAFSKERLEAIRVDVAINGETATLETIYPPAPPAGSILVDRSGTVDYTIVLPQTCKLAQVELANGEIIIEGMRGPAVEVHLGNGRMFLDNCFSAVRAQLGRGGLDVSYGWWEASAVSLSAEVGEGDARVYFPPNPALHLDAATTKGHIKSYFAGEQISGDGRMLDTKLGGDSSAELRLRTTSGNIKIEKSY